MKFRSIFTKALLASALAISQNLFFVSGADQAKAQGSPRPYVVLVNGYQDCCVWSTSDRGVYMGAVYRELQARGADFRLVPWDTFVDGAGQISNISNDKDFLDQAVSYINTLDPNRPLILIGHSFGGDSLLSLLSSRSHQINRRIQFLGVIDPTAAGGLREPVTRRRVPSNVDYFFNRWQRNGVDNLDLIGLRERLRMGGGSARNIVPFDSRIVSGLISGGGLISGCHGSSCSDQQERSTARRGDGSEIRVSLKLMK
jgi:pimeloyl-ACP methyl ester carboxylesterase